MAREKKPVHKVIMILGLKNITRIVITHDQRPEVLRKFDGVINI